MIRAIARFRPSPSRVVLPDTACDVLWVDGRLLLTGPQRVGRPSAHVGKEVLLLKVDPSAARAVLGVPIVELTDRVELLADVQPRLASLIAEHIERGTVAALVGKPIEGTDGRFVAAARALTRGTKVRAAARLVGVGERQLERLFALHCGLSPARYSRINRLRRSLEASRGLSLAQAAALGGYADQSHFSRDVRELTGRTPRTLMPDVGSVQDLVMGSF